MIIPTEPIGSIPRPVELISAIKAAEEGWLSPDELTARCDVAVLDTLRRFEETGSPVISDGEQRKNHNFADYCVHGLPNFASDGFKLQFLDHYRQWPRLTAGPFRYANRADRHVAFAVRNTRLPVKQAVISPSALSLFYPAEPIADYVRERFIEDLLSEHEAEIRGCFLSRAHSVQVDFTEGRLACKLDPSGQLLANFVRLNNLALSRFTEAERSRIGIHTCPGGDCDSTHSADVDYSELLPSLFELKARNFFVALARERDRGRVLDMIRRHLRSHQRVFVGVIDVLDPRIETAAEVRDRVLEAAEYIPLAQLGTTDDCGYSPFCDDVSTTREKAFAKIRARVEGTAWAADVLSSRN
jgi:5-methyltetrahydropteroyltriglutamate--homocysteine methyltransferase